MGGEFPDNNGQSDQPHIEHQGLVALDKIVPGQIAGIVLEMAGHETYRLSVVPMGQWYSGISRATGGRRDPGNYLEPDTGAGQGLDFLSAADIGGKKKK